MWAEPSSYIAPHLVVAIVGGRFHFLGEGGGVEYAIGVGGLGRDHDYPVGLEERIQLAPGGFIQLDT